MLELKDYQHQAIQHLNDHPKAGLFLDMGLGKTAAVLHTLTEEHLPALVIAPKRVAEHVWQAERKKWKIGLSMALAIGGPAKRQTILWNKIDPVDIVVVGVDNIKDTPIGVYKTIILDESSKFKGRGVRWRCARKLTKDATYVWALTGTPAPNGLIDLWAQIFLLDRGQRLETGIGKYRDRYFDPGRRIAGGKIVGWDLKPGAEASIHRKIDDICLSMSSVDHLDLPSVTYNEVGVPLPPKAMKVYADLKDTLVADLSLLGEPVFTAANAAVLTNKLSQVSAGFLYEDDLAPMNLWLHNEKIKAIQEIVDGTGSPVLVFYGFAAERDRILADIEGAVSIDAEDAIDRWNRGEVAVLVAHPASAGHGLNLQYGGHTIVWATLTWSLEQWEQGNKRIHRQGQEHPVVIHCLLSPDTIDPHMLQRVRDKVTVQNALLDHLKVTTL